MLLAARFARKKVGMTAWKSGDGSHGLICSTFVERVLRHTLKMEFHKDKEIVLPVQIFKASRPTGVGSREATQIV